MNKITLDELFNRYEENIDMLYDAEHDEIFKWRALKTFQKEWFSLEYTDFLSRFNAATKDFSVFIDNSRMHPRNGIVKLYEKDPHEVERLFCEVLFAADEGDLEVRQQNMDTFIDGMEKLREKYYPANWSFKQDRHSASTFLAMYAPKENYVYKYSEAETMAIYSEFGFDIGAGIDFSLPHYYKMCDEIVEALKGHDTLLQKHFSKLDADCFDEQSLHLLAFDVMYCCKMYGLYQGLSHITKRDSIKAAKEAEQQREAAAQLQEKIDALSAEIESLELSLPDVSDISLMNVEVKSKLYGTGTVIEQEVNKIKVRFSDTTKTFILDKKYSMRPTFENDEEVVEVYSEFSTITDRLRVLRQQLENTKSLL